MGLDSSHNSSRKTSSPACSLSTMSGPRVDRSQMARCPSHSTEIEAKFFMPCDIATSLTENLQFSRIEQHYFPRRLVARLIHEFAVAEHVPEVEAFSSARIRRTRLPSGETTFHLEFKGKKEDFQGSLISRREFGLPLSENLHRRLKELADSGSIKKRRYDIEGHIQHRGTNVPALAQIDIVVAAGTPLRKIGVDFTTVDIELPRVELLRPLQAGRHSFSFLQACVDVSFDGSERERNLTTRQIAKDGFARAQQKALSRLEKIAKTLL